MFITGETFQLRQIFADKAKKSLPLEANMTLSKMTLSRMAAKRYADWDNNGYSAVYRFADCHDGCKNHARKKLLKRINALAYCPEHQ